MFNLGDRFIRIYSIFSNFSIRGGGALIEVVFFLLVANRLGLEDSSRYFVAYSFFLVMVAFSRGGADFKVVRDIPGCCEKNNMQEIRITIFEAFLKVIVYSLIMILLSVFLDFLGFFNYVLGNDSADILKMFIFAVMPVALIYLCSEIFRGYQSIQFSQFIYGWVVLGPTLLWVSMRGDFNSEDLVKFYISSSYCVLIIILVLLNRRVHFLKSIRLNLSYSLLKVDTFFFTRLTVLVSVWLPVWIINFTKNHEAVGMFVVANRFAMGVTLALVAVEASAGPKFAEIYKNNSMSLLYKTLKNTQYLSVGLSLLIGIILIMMSYFIADYLGIQSKGVFVSIIGILVSGYIINGFFAPIGTLFQMTFNENLALRAYLNGVFYGAFILILLLSFFGELGLAFGCSFIYLIRGVQLNKMRHKVFDI